MKTLLWTGLFLAAAAQAPAAFVHTTDADFRVGSGDGNVDIGAGDGDGSVRLAKLAGTLGAWSSVGTLPAALRLAGIWASGDRLWIVGGYGSTVTNTVKSLTLDAAGNVVASGYHSTFPAARYDLTTVRWGKRLYAGLGFDSGASGQIYVTEPDVDGAPTGWTLAGTLPVGVNVDHNGQLAIDYGRLVYVASNPNGVAGSSLSYSAPLNPDGTLGAWSSEDGRDYSHSAFSLSSAMGALITVGGEDGSWVGSTAVDRIFFNAAGALGSWASATALPAGRSYIAGQQGAWAGKLFQTGGKSYSGGATYFNTVYSNPLSAGAALGAWAAESTLPANRSQHMLVGAKGGLYVVGGSANASTPVNTVYRASFNQGSANAAQGVYVHGYDLGSDQVLASMAFDAVPAGQASVQVRTALSGQSFGGWTVASSTSPLALTWSARHVEYRVVLNDSTNLSVRLEMVALHTPAPTPTPTPSSTPNYSTIHTTDDDFRLGSGDGNVVIGAGDGDGSVRLAKLAGTLGAWENAGTLAYPVRSGAGYVRNGHAWWLGGVTVGLTDTVMSTSFDGAGMVATSGAHSKLPLSTVNGGVAQWGRWLFAGMGSPIAGVYRAQLAADGAPSAWTLAAAPPAGLSSDGNIRLGADYGRLYWIPGTFNAATYSAPIGTDGSLGAWQTEDSRNYSHSAFGFAWSMGRFFVIGGENGAWVGQTAVDMLPVSAAGAGTWAAGTALPGGRSYIDSYELAWAGKLFLAGGKSYASGNTFFTTVYSNPLGVGGSMGSWASESTLPAESCCHQIFARGGYLYMSGGSPDAATPSNTVFRASLNQGSANAAQGVYVNAFDSGSNQALAGLAFVAVPAGQVSVQVRTALDGQGFGGWTAASTSSPISLTWSARYVEYRALFSDGGAGDVRLEQVQVTTPTPTPVVDDEIDKYKGGPFKGEEGEAIAFPNPASGGQTKFGFTLEEAGVATITVWTSGGTLASQISDSFGPGKGLLKLNIKDYAPGVYLYQLVIDYSGGRKVSGPVKKFAVMP